MKTTLAMALGCIILTTAPAYSQGTTEQQTKKCIENLIVLDGATEQYALEYKQPGGTTVTMEILMEKDYITRPRNCPTSGTYTIGPVGTLPTCTVKGHTIEGRN